ncbi:MAG: hypothetical protein RSD57_04500 [Comamonas sp.]
MMVKGGSAQRQPKADNGSADPLFSINRIANNAHPLGVIACFMASA